jgi:AcrR family transcriptional regulator
MQFGYSGVGMRMIAEEAGIRAASVYHHFSSKEEILRRISFRVTVDFIVEHLPALEGPGSHVERLEKVLSDQVVYLWNNRTAWFVATRELRSLTPDNLREIQGYRRDFQRRIVDFIRSGVRAGEFQCDDPTLASLALLSMINGVNDWFRQGGRYSIEELAAREAHMIVGKLLSADYLKHHQATPLDQLHPRLLATAKRPLSTTPSVSVIRQRRPS